MNDRAKKQPEIDAKRPLLAPVTSLAIELGRFLGLPPFPSPALPKAKRTRRKAPRKGEV